MDWNQPQPPQPVGPQNMQAPPMQGGQVPAANGVSFGANPLQGGPMMPQPPMAAPPSSPLQNPITAAPAPMPVAPQPLPNNGIMQPATPGPAQATLNDDKDVSADDAVWINRAKRAIAETKGDPHRQTQLIQHLRSQYLKQRFGRNVHTDEAGA